MQGKTFRPFGGSFAPSAGGTNPCQYAEKHYLESQKHYFAFKHEYGLFKFQVMLLSEGPARDPGCASSFSASCVFLMKKITVIRFFQPLTDKPYLGMSFYAYLSVESVYGQEFAAC